MLSIQYIQYVNQYHFTFLEKRRLGIIQSRFQEQALKFYRQSPTTFDNSQANSSFWDKIKDENLCMDSTKTAEPFKTVSSFARTAPDLRLQTGDENSATFAKESIVKARRKILQLVLHNAGREIKFLTLTFDNNNLPENFPDALKKVQDFFKRWQYHIFPNKSETRDERHTLKYIAIPELGEKKKRIHFHAIVIAPYIANKTLREKIWKNGFVKIDSIRAQNNLKVTKAVASYVAKYISKDCVMLDGRKRIYYASHNWNSDCNKAIATEKQARNIYHYANSLNNSKYVQNLYISFIDFSRKEIRNAPPDFYARAFQYRDALKFFDTDFIKIEFDLPRKIAENFIAFLQEIKLDIYKADFMKKSKKERAEEKSMIELLSLYEDFFFDKRTREETSAEIKKLYPLIPSEWIDAILWDIHENGNENIFFNNLPLLSKNIADINFNEQTAPKLLMSALTVKFYYTLHSRRVMRTYINPKNDELVSNAAIKNFFNLDTKQQEVC